MRTRLGLIRRRQPRAWRQSRCRLDRRNLVRSALEGDPFCFLFGLTRLDTRVRSLNTLRLGANIGPGPPLAVFELQDILNIGVELVLPRCVLWKSQILVG